MRTISDKLEVWVVTWKVENVNAPCQDAMTYQSIFELKQQAENQMRTQCQQPNTTDVRLHKMRSKKTWRVKYKSPFKLKLIK